MITLSKYRVAIRLKDLAQLLSLLCGAIYLAHSDVEVYAQGPCKVNLRQVERDIERYRKKQTPGIESKYQLMECRQTLPLLERYIVDPDPEVRSLLAEYLVNSQRRPITLLRIGGATPTKNWKPFFSA